MSAIFGIINTNGKPCEIAVLKKMQSPMDYYGPDGKYLWNEENAGLGQLQLYNTPESVNEKFPLLDNERGLVFVSAARIDNRNELFDLLSIPNEQKLTVTDAQLMFNAYRKWGKECVQRLLGDWSFAVWHKKEKELFLARDHHGITGIYYYEGNGFFVFSSSLKGILALPEVPKKINELRVAQILVSWHGDGVQNCYQDILRLPPSHYLTVNPEKVEKTRYWFLENEIKELKYPKDEDYSEHFRELFTEAVRCRLRSYKKVGSTLSSGLDSSSVSVVAANLLKEKGIRLPVFTSVPMYECQHLHPNRLADEGPLAAEVVKFNGNMDHYLLKSEDISVLEGIKKAIEIHDQPLHAAGNAYWIIDMMGKAKDIGCGTLLTGQLGNATISWATQSYYNRIKISEPHAKRFDYFKNWNLFKKYIIKKCFPKPIFDINTLKRHKKRFIQYSAIHHKFVKRLHLFEKIENEKFDLRFSINQDSIKARYAIIKPGYATIGHIWHETAANFDIEVRDPAMDKRILLYCLSIPDIQYITENKNRILLRNIMRNNLPYDVLWNLKKGIQASDLAFRIHNEYYDFINTVKLIQNKYCIVDKKKITQCLNSINNNRIDHNLITSVLLRGILTAIWLDKI